MTALRAGITPETPRGTAIVSNRDAFSRILTSLHDAMLDDARWPATSALIDEACGLTGNTLMVGEGPKDDVRVSFVGLYYRGERREDLEREYLEIYHPIDERIPRVRRQPHGRLVHVTDQYTAAELKTSRAYNEALRRGQYQDSFAVRVGGLGDTHVSWGIGDPVGSRGWASSQVSMLQRLVPHVRQFVRVRQALVRAEAQRTTVTALLDNPWVGVVHLDRRGRILSANDRARTILREGDGMTDRDGGLHARESGDEARLAKLVAAALPRSDGAQAQYRSRRFDAVSVSGSMLLWRGSVRPPFAVHVKPVPIPQPDYGARHVAALVLIAELGRRTPVDRELVASALGLTPAESQVAVWLAEGRSVREMAEATGNTKDAVYWHRKSIYKKLAVSRQADLVRLVLSLADLG